MNQLKSLMSKLEGLGRSKGNPLIAAARDGDVKKVRELCRNKPKLMEEVDERGYTALMAASREGELGVVKALIKEKCKINVTNNDSQTALHLACAKGYSEIVSALLAAKARVDVIDGYKMTPLIYASHNDKLDIVKILLQKEPDLELAKKSFEGTALVAAAKQGNKEIVELLLEHRAEVSATNGKGETPFIAVAENKGATPILKMLMEAKAEPTGRDNDGKTALIKAAALGDTDMGSFLLPLFVEAKMVDAQETTGETALYHAASGGIGHNFICRELLEAKANPELCTEEGDTPLIAAAANDRCDTIKLLLFWGKANANHKNKQGVTAYKMAYIKEQKEAAKILKNETEMEVDPSLGGFMSTDGRGTAAFVSTFSTADAGKPQKH
jgi:ankyrin repeat protein